MEQQLAEPTEVLVNISQAGGGITNQDIAAISVERNATDIFAPSFKPKEALVKIPKAGGGVISQAWETAESSNLKQQKVETRDSFVKTPQPGNASPTRKEEEDRSGSGTRALKVSESS